MTAHSGKPDFLSASCPWRGSSSPGDSIFRRDDRGPLFRKKPHFRMLLAKSPLTLVTVVLCIVFAEFTLRTFVAVRMVGPVGSTYDPIYGKRLKRNYTCLRTSAEFTFQLSTNSWGLRGPEWPRPPEGSLLFLGDSFTMGYAVNDGEEYPELARYEFDARYGKGVVPVVNAGLANNGNRRWIKFLRRDAYPIEPRLVTLQLSENNFADNVNKQLFRLDKGALQELPIPPQSRVGRLVSLIEDAPVLRSTHLMAAIRIASVKLFGGNRKKGQLSHKDYQLTYRMLEETLNICDRHGWPVLVILVSSRDYRPDRFERVRQILHRYKVSVIHAPTKHERPDLYWTEDPHWNAKEHDWVARAVVGQLTSDLQLKAAVDRPAVRITRSHSTSPVATAKLAM